jgi:hypothetical protein
MRKNIIDAAGAEPAPNPEGWLDIERLAKVELTSEDPDFPIESAVSLSKGPGWRASGVGEQIIRIIFDQPTRLRRIRLQFVETETQRTQEFTLRWSAEPGGPFREIVRQQWTFSPQGSTSEVEDYQVGLDNVSVLELALKPDLTYGKAFATLTMWRLGR